MGLFDKKYCSICGEKISLLGNRKLEDGNLCKKCAGLLSPWFGERRHSTVEDIRRQLDYRERNREDVRSFRATRTLGGHTRVYLDEDSFRFMVTSSKDLEKDNPDVLECARLTDCRTDVTEHKNELRREDSEGNRVSYDPPRYEYSYDFYVILRVDHPYIDEIRFRTNSSSVKTGEISARGHRPGGMRPTDPAGARPPMPSLAPRPAAAPLSGRGPFAEYDRELALAEEICSALTDLRRRSREELSLKNETVTCPHCGAPTRPGPDGRCEYCGGSVKD